MKIQYYTTLLILLGTLLASAQTERYATITATAVQVPPNDYKATNQISIVEGETAQVVSFLTSGGSGAISYCQKDGAIFNSISSSGVGANGATITGPATFTVVAQGQDNRGLLTLKIMPNTFAPDKTLIIPPGTNQFSISLESSTNLVNWSTATNGIYGSPDEARFFRIHMQKVN